LTNVTAQHGRAEETRGRKFDVAVSRAVAPLATLWTWARPLLRKPKTPDIPSTPKSLSPGDPASSPDAEPTPSGLICLKGGDLAAEISTSGLRPRIMEIHDIFPLDSFRDKYLLQVPF